MVELDVRPDEIGHDVAAAPGSSGFTRRRFDGRMRGERRRDECMSNSLSRLLEQKEVVIADGAMGTNLFHLGLGKGDSTAAWNVGHPDVVTSIHQAFVDAGADILLTNTFAANRIRLALHALEARSRELNVAGARIARAVADRAGRPIVVAGDTGPIGDVLEPLGTRSVREAEEAFLEQARALKEGGVDIAWIETMFADNELDAAVRAVHEAGLDYIATMTFDSAGRTVMGVRPEDAIRRSRTFPWKPLAFGANCGVGPSQLMDSVLGLVQGAEGDMIIVAKSNCGIPVLDDDLRVSYSGTPEVLGAYARMARDAGARIIGGCCGTTPEHVRAIVAALAGEPKGRPPSYAEIERRLGPLTVTTHAEGAAGSVPQRNDRSASETVLRAAARPRGADPGKGRVGPVDSWAQVVREALMLLDERDRTRVLRRERLLRELLIGIDQANDRQLVDGLEVFRRLRNKPSEAG